MALASVLLGVLVAILPEQVASDAHLLRLSHVNVAECCQPRADLLVTPLVDLRIVRVARIIQPELDDALAVRLWLDLDVVELVAEYLDGAALCGRRLPLWRQLVERNSHGVELARTPRLCGLGRFARRVDRRHRDRLRELLARLSYALDVGPHRGGN